MTSSGARKYRGLALVAAAAVLAACAQAPATTGAAPASTDAAPPSTGAPSASTGAAPSSPAGPATADPAATPEPAAPITPAAADEVDGGPRGVSRSRTVTVDTGALPDGTAAEDLELPLFDDTTVTVDLGAPTSRPEGGYRTWRGTIDGDEGSTVVLVEQDGVLSGLVTSKDATYRLRPLPDGSTRVEQIDESQFPTTYAHATPPADGGFTPAVTTDDGHAHAPGTPEHSHEPAAEGHAHAPGTPEHSHDVPPPAAAAEPDGPATEVPATSAATADAPVVDVLVAYSSAARTYNGGQAGMDAEIALMVEQTNTAFDTSGINAVLRLAHTAEVGLNGPVDGATLGRLANPSDGVYDELHVLRDQYGADLVALITTSPSGPYCGIAYQMTSISTGFAPYAMSVTDAGCATGNTTFTHELGHNFGAAHDRGSWSGTPALPYGYDWVNPQQGWRTVMAYANACMHCGKILRFSNPDQTYNGAPLGAPAGAANAADNRSVLNTTSSTVSSMRGAPVAASLTLTGPSSGQEVPASGSLVTTWSTSGYLGSDAKVELLRGDSVVRVLTPKAPLGAGRFAVALPVTTARGADYRVRVTPLSGPQHATTSDPFAVVDPQITPTAPATVTPGATTRVSWTYTGAPAGTVKVELLKDGKVIAVPKASTALGAGGAGSTDVVLPAALNDGGGYRLRTTLSAVPAAPGLTGTVSVTSSRRLVVTAPGSGGTHGAGTPLTVTWTASGDVGATVRAELVKADAVVLTTPTAPATGGSLTFTPPARLPSGDDYRVRLVSGTFPTVVAASPDRFSVAGTSLTITSQDSPSTISAGTRLPITFGTVGVPGTAVKLEALAPGLAPVVVAAGVPLSTGTYSWAVPVGLPRAAWTVRGTVVGNPLVTDTSAAATTVTWPSVSASAPASGVAGVPVTVSWSFTDGAVAPVRVRLLQGATVVATGTPSGVTAADGTGSLTWPLPIGLAAGSYRFDVAAAANTALTSATGAVSVTRPGLSAAAPATGVAGAPVSVSWAFTDGAVAPVRVRLVQGSRVVATVTSKGVTGADGTGSLSYRLPVDLAPGSYAFDVAPTAALTLLRTTGAVTASRPTLSVAGATSVARGQTATLTWAFTGGAAAPVRIELVQGTRVVVVRSGAVTANDGTGSFAYRAPSTLGTGAYTLRVRPVLLATSTAVEATRPFTVS